MMAKRRRQGSCDNRDGFIVVAALWILSALAALASVYSIYVANAAISVALNDDSIRAEALVSASLELTAYQLTASAAKDRPSRGAFAFRMNGANVAVEFRSEAARVDLNKASKALLAGLFGALGAHPDDAEQYADRIVGWRSAPPSGSQNKEESQYQAAGLNYGPRGAPFAHVGELALVLGLPPAMVDRAIPYVTVYSGRSEVNVRDAAPEVIAALPGMTPERLNMVLNDRQSLSAQSSLALLGPAQAEATTEGSKATRVAVRMAFDNGRTIFSEAVILVDGRNEPYRVLSWQDDADAQPSLQPAVQNAVGGRS
jgi:general secretion pathway protein K